MSLDSRQNTADFLLHASVPFHLDTRNKTAECMVHDSLPDHSCTPGAVFARATPDVICVLGYTKTVRNVSTATKKKVFREYGMSYPAPYGTVEIDHVIPLELGGSNDIANLFPEAADPVPGFREKDLVEDYLHEEVCAGVVDIKVAQEQIANDWVRVYKTLSPEEIDRLQQAYKSWAS